MCGIVGLLEKELRREQWEERLGTMTNTLAHRGPDDYGIWYHPEQGIGLGHRRLSILDLTSRGHQPMISRSGRYSITYNGEVYNFQELGKSLESYGWVARGRSDTEVILGAIEQWSLRESVRRFRGMFAFGLWDQEEETLHLVRDRLGIKPLYYGWIDRAFVFASELKPFRCHPRFSGLIDRNALALFMRYGFIPGPHCIYQGIYKLLPGKILSLRFDSGRFQSRSEAYWSPSEVLKKDGESRVQDSVEAAVSQLDALLKEAVQLRMVADVPVGAFLSGGIDSSTIVALMQQQSSVPVRTFSIGFHEPSYNEAEHAKAVAQHLGTEHSELYVSRRQVGEVVPQLPTFYDEPFSDHSQIPTYLVSCLARQQVVVSLSGDGGDELFCGYLRYQKAADLQERCRKGRLLLERITRLSPLSAEFVSRALLGIHGRVLQGRLARLVALLPQRGLGGAAIAKLHIMAESLEYDDADQVYVQFMSLWTDPQSLVLGSSEPSAFSHHCQKIDNPIERMMYLDMVGYLPDDILTKVDRATMSVGLEARVPFLDPRVVAFAWKLPFSFKRRNGLGKWLLRQVLDQYVPRELIDRPKMGFSTPIGSWLRGPLRSWAEELVDESRLQQEGYLDPQLVRKRWTQHLNDTNWGNSLWSVLMFQAWLEAQN